MEVRGASGWVGESAPLLKRGHDVHEYRGFDVWRWAGSREEAVADSSAAVVGYPVDGTVGGVWDDFLEDFDDGEADLAFIGGGWEGAYAVAWELGDE